jgi:hypothetical protein
MSKVTMIFIIVQQDQEYHHYTYRSKERELMNSTMQYTIFLVIIGIHLLLLLFSSIILPSISILV